MAEERFPLTQTGYEQLKTELENLEREHAAQQQDFADVNYSNDPSHEEAAYDEVRTTKDDLEEKIGHLKLVLQNAEVISEDADPEGVNLGERVTVWDSAAKETLQFDLIGSEEATHGREGVTDDSPVGKALLGKRIGDVVEVDVPDGKMRYVIRKIEPLPTGESGESGRSRATF